VYFTLAISAATPEQCAALTNRARVTDPRVMPIPGPVAVVWQAADGRSAMVRWGADADDAAGGGTVADDAVTAPASQAGTIWVEESAGAFGAPLRARTALARVDPVYVAGAPGVVIVSDRAFWAAAVSGRLGDRDPLHACALLTVGFPLGAVTPFPGVRALDGATALEIRGGAWLERPVREAAVTGDRPAAGRAAPVAEALVAAVRPLRSLTAPVELSLTGGRDSRLVVAALVAAGVPVRARTHGFAGHPDVLGAAEIARRLGVSHEVRTPAAPDARIDVATRLRATVLVADGMLSAFENVGRPDRSPSSVVTAGGHGGELLRGGYAETAAGGRWADGAAARARRAARAGELLRRMTTRHLGLLRPGAAARHAARLRPWSGAALARGPVTALEEFYLVNRAGRWSAAARQAYLLRENLVQPLFDDRVVRAARAAPLGMRASGELSAAVLAELCPGLADVPLAGKAAAAAPPAGAAGPASPASFDWRRQYGAEVAGFLREYTLDLGAIGGLFCVVSRAAAEKALAPPHADRGTVWALATLACLLSGDYLHAREESPLLPVR
jgi:Asparagine synthase